MWSSILNSTVWAESKEVRLLWITMLAMKDQDGLVESSLVGLAKQAGLSFEETKEAIVVLESPDQRSEIHQEYDGRRVKRVEGGWLVLNHLKYRDEIAKLRERQRKAEYQRNWRARQKLVKGAGKPGPGEMAGVAAMERGDEAGADRIIEETLPEVVRGRVLGDATGA